MQILKRLWRQTVWSKGAIPPEEWRYRSQKRFWYPTIDFLFIGLGWSCIYFGIPAINEFFPDWQVDLFGVGLLVWAHLALVGVAFYRLWWLEIIAKCMLIGQMASYISALLILTAYGSNARGFIAGIAMLATVPMMMRLSVVAAEWQERRVQQHSDSEHKPWSEDGQREIRHDRSVEND